MKDLIERQAAIDALSNMMDIDGFRDGYAVSRANVNSMLKRLPPAQPERKHGYWIESREHVYMCNEVKEWTNWYCSECDTPNSWPTDFCPYCGTDMRRNDDESN